ncbi:MAG: hypothetical protein AAFX85_18780, partial [Pseudomonadota bacterium]
MKSISSAIVRMTMLALFVTGVGAAAVPSVGLKTLEIGRNAHYVVVLPGDDDTFESLAARYLGDTAHAWQLREASGNDELSAETPVVIPLRPANPGRVSAQTYQVVPVLCYHRFGT